MVRLYKVGDVPSKKTIGGVNTVGSLLLPFSTSLLIGVSKDCNLAPLKIKGGDEEDSTSRGSLG